MYIVAKKARNKLNEYLPTVYEHCRDVYICGDTTISHVESSLKKIFSWCYKDLISIARSSFWGHDIGKAYNFMQDMLKDKSPTKHILPARHELISCLFLFSKQFYGKHFENAITSNQMSKENYWLLIWTILSHHQKINTNSETYIPSKVRSGFVSESVDFYSGHSDVVNCINEICKIFGIPEISPTEETVQIKTEEFAEMVYTFSNSCEKMWKELFTEGVLLKLFHLRCLVCCADTYGSAMANDLTRCSDAPVAMANRIAEFFSSVCSLSDYNRLLRIELGTSEYNALQQEVLDWETEIGNFGIICSGCGSGKTIASKLFHKMKSLDRKFFQLYPTVGTGNQEYNDNIYHKQSSGFVLKNSMAKTYYESKIEIVEILDGGEDEKEELEERIELIKSINILRAKWLTGTVDTILPILDNQRKAMIYYPFLLNGALVFDEVHTYDPHGFLCLTEFIRFFPTANIVVMSASLAQKAIEHLQEAATGRCLSVIYGDDNKENLKRYKIQEIKLADVGGNPASELENLIIQMRKENKKVLWVLNQVDRCKDCYSKLKQILGKDVSIFLHHGRFKKIDELKKQKTIMQHFNRGASRQFAIAVTTQICEMSLNISSDVLLTDYCPLSVLIQRLGRLVRFLEYGDELGDCYIYNTPTEVPYIGTYYKPLFEGVNKLLEEYYQEPVSRADLSSLLDRFYELPQWKLSERPAIISCGWESWRKHFRNISHHISVVEKQDISKITKRHYQYLGMQDVAGFVYRLPRPKTEEMKANLLGADKIGPYYVVESGWANYCEEFGGSWKE